MNVTHHERVTGESCDLLLGNPPESCRLCATALTGRRRVWCSDLCESMFYRNHQWTAAREYAVMCSMVDDERGRGFLCACCKSLTSKPEVNHKTPILGRHGVVGCHHHQDGLEVLCHACHVRITNAQRARGWHAAVSHGELALWQQPDLFGDVPPVDLADLSASEVQLVLADVTG